MGKYICTSCGKEFERHPSATKRNKSGNFYCSRKCAAQRQQKELPDLKCPQCGKTFYRKPSERRLSNNYCSRKCANKAQSRSLQDIPELRTTNGPEKKCEHCGNLFPVKPYRYKTRRFCSRACFHAHRFGGSHPRGKAVNLSGKNNPNFKNATTRTTARDFARKAFGDACMICGWDVHVDVHHIIPMRHGGTNNIDNLIVLCPNHHRMADAGMIPNKELTNLVLSAIAQQSDLQPLFDQLRPYEPESDLQEPLFSEPESTSQSG